MKVTCEYCDSVVDAENNDTCPNCGAPLANSRKAREAELNEERLKKEAEEREERAALEAMIRQVENPDERAVLRLRYFDRADWDGICAVLFSDRQDYLERIDSYQNRTYKIHGRALLNLAAVLDELRRIEAGGSVNDELLDVIEMIAAIMDGMRED